MVTMTSTSERVRIAVRTHYPAVWRSLRRLGASEADADDIAQDVFLVFSKRVSDVVVEYEKRFLFRTAFNMLATTRRSRARRREESDDAIDEMRDSSPTPEEQWDERQRLETLDRLLGQLPFELRAVLTLCAIEQVTARDAAEILELPQGTVASRLARARETMADLVRRERARGPQ